MRRPARITVGIKDWNGDAVITIVAGVALFICLFLPWANVGEHQGMNWSLTKPGDINGALHTPWGVPMLVCCIVVIACGVLMRLIGPRRLAFLLGVVVFTAGLYAGKLATDGAWHAMGWGYSGGVGVAGALLIALLLLPIGFASAAVGFMIAYWAPKQALPSAAIATSVPEVAPVEVAPAVIPVETTAAPAVGIQPPTDPPAP